MCLVRRGIRTLAHRSGLRPERSALDRSAILTYEEISVILDTILISCKLRQKIYSLYAETLIIRVHAVRRQ
jgi:hypothetical protein